jgi:biotin operon repressor
MGTKMLMRRWGKLQDKKDKLMKDLKETTLSLDKLGEAYGVSGQAILAFCKKQGIKRPKRPRGHQTGECLLCQKLIQISKKPHSDFTSIHTIAKKTGKLRAEYLYHLRILRDKGLVSERFGRLRSKKAEKAYAIYFTKRLAISRIGRKVGIRNFQSLIQKHRELGWNVPPSLYIYNGREKSTIQSEIQRRK